MRSSRWSTNPLPLTDVRLTNGFCANRVRINREATIPAVLRQLKHTGRIDNFRLSWKTGDANPPHPYSDSDVAKWVEAASYSLTTHPDPELQAQLGEVVQLVVAAQQEDGYLNTYFTQVRPEARWTNLRDEHELYCAGHLIEAAVAHHAATGSHLLLDAACRFADYIGTVFGAQPHRRKGYPGHEEIELALIKLHHATGKRDYLDLALYFVNERGREPQYFDLEARERGEADGTGRPGGYDYCQAHIPPREQVSAEGHAVRACYLYAAMADAAVETGDEPLFDACRRIWRNIVERRSFVHGGVGSTGRGERFTFDYDLPCEQAYAETCAAIGLFLFGHRMLRAEPCREYADAMERALYNAILPAVSIDGTKFFYDNVLANSPARHRFGGRRSPTRQEWFDTACCPGNLARLLASLGQYLYATFEHGVYVHFFASSQARFRMGDTPVTLVQSTNYPWDGGVHLRVEVPRPVPFALRLRVPSWCREPSLAVNWEKAPCSRSVPEGYVEVKREWKDGDRVDLVLPMAVRRIHAHPAVDATCGRVAMFRGPLLYCAEEADNGPRLNDLLLRRDGALVVERCPIEGLGIVPLIRTPASRRDISDWEGILYHRKDTAREPCEVTAVPYFLWGNRTCGEMLVWMRYEDAPFPE